MLLSEISKQCIRVGEKTGRLGGKGARKRDGGGTEGACTTWARSDGKLPNPSPETD